MYTRPTMLSSEIVRPVFQRDARRREAIDGDNNCSDVPKTSMLGIERFSSLDNSRRVSMTKSALPFKVTAFISPSRPSSSSTSRRFQPTEPYVASRYAVDGDDALTIASACASRQAEHFEGKQPQFKRKRVRLKAERRREQSRANQARYRQKQLVHAKTLEDTVQKLRADIPVLELQCNHLLYGGQQNVWNVVVEYFHVFRFGVPVSLAVAEDDVVNQAEQIESAVIRHQLALLRSSMAEDVILGERSGVMALMEQWQQYSSSFQSLYFQLDRIERTNDTFVSATATLNVTASATTLQCIFPRLLRDEISDEDDAESQKERVRSKLLGRRLQIPCSLCFEWDAERCCVARLEMTINIMTPLMKALRNLRDVAFVLEHALITRDGAVGVRTDKS